MTSADNNGIELQIGDDVTFAGVGYTVENIVLDPKQTEFCTAELDMANGIRAYCFNMTKV